MHTNYFFSTYALIARVLAATFPRLTIVDADWTTTQGPSNLTYVQHTSWLAASTDPAAVSWYTAKFMLTPIAVSPNQTNPDLPGSAYRNCLTNWVNYLHNTAGLPCTKDSTQISVYNRSVLTSIQNEKQGNLPEGFLLYQNYPNPFNPETKIRFDVPDASPSRGFTAGRGVLMSLKVYDLLGHEITTLINRPLQPGTYEVTWDSSKYPSGIFYYRLTAGKYSETKKMVVVK